MERCKVDSSGKLITVLFCVQLLAKVLIDTIIRCYSIHRFGLQA